MKKNPFDIDEEIIGEGMQIMFISKDITNDLPPREYYNKYMKYKKITDTMANQFKDIENKIEIYD